MAARRDGLGDRLRDFVHDHPSGWDHQDWEGLLGSLDAAGFDVSDSGAVGLELERVRLEAFLEGIEVKGLGPKRRATLASEFGTVWRLRHASVDEIASIPTVNRSLAERVREALN